MLESSAPASNRPAFDCILIRHGEPECAADIYLGHSDPGLADLGRRQIAATVAWCAQQWPAFKPSRIYASSLRRAQESAALVADVFAVPVQHDSRINEIYFGDWEGRSFTEVEALVPGAFERWIQNPLQQPAPGGENFSDLALRVDDFLASLHSNPAAEECIAPQRCVAPQRCIIVAHYCSLAVLASRLLGVPLSHADRLALHRGGCGRISDGQMQVWGMSGNLADVGSDAEF